MSVPSSNQARVGLIIDGRPYTAEPADDGTVLYNVRDRDVISSAGPTQVISLICEPVDTELADRAASMRRVKAAASGPFTPRSQRPSARQAAVRRLARENHQAVWSNGYSQAQAEFDRRALEERITEADVPNLIALVLERVLASPELRTQFVKSVEAIEFEAEMLGTE